MEGLMIKKEFIVNGVRRKVFAAPNASLATVLRENLGLTGTKVGCNQGQCGATDWDQGRL